MANLAANFTIRVQPHYSQTSNRAIASIRWQAGESAQTFAAYMMERIATRGTRDLWYVVNHIRHNMITYDEALNAAGSRRYSRTNYEVTEAVRYAIYEAIVQFIDRSGMTVINRQGRIIQQYEVEIETLTSQLGVAFNAIEGLLTAPGVDETSADWQAAYAQYELLADQLS